MISITLTGNTIDEVGGQALALVMKLAGAQPAVVQQPADLVPQAPEPAPAEPAVDLNPTPLGKWLAQGQPPAEGEAKLTRKRRTRAEIDAANAAAQKASTIGVLVKGEPFSDEEALAAAMAQEAEGDNPPVEPTRAEVLAEMPPTFDDLKRALQEVCETNGAGVDAAKKLMADFATPPRLSLIKEERWPEFIKRARAVVAGARK